MFGHGQQYDDAQNPPQSPWSAPSTVRHNAPDHEQPHQEHYMNPPPQYALAQNASTFYDYAAASTHASSIPGPEATSSDPHALNYPAQPGYVQQVPQQQKMTDHEPPNSAGSVGSDSVSSGESAATTGPTNVSRHSNSHYSHQTLPQTPSVVAHSDTPASTSSQAHAPAQASSLFDVPPGYRTMLSSDKASTALPQEPHAVEGGGSAPVRHNSMPSSMFSSYTGPLASSSASSGVEQHQRQHQYHSSSQPVFQHLQHQRQYNRPPSASASSNSLLFTPVSHYTASPAPLPHTSPPQQEAQHFQLQHASSHQDHSRFPSSMTTASGPTSFATSSGSSNVQIEPSNNPISTTSSRYPRRSLHQSDTMVYACSPHPTLLLSNPNDTHFLAPPAPISAPATMATFVNSGTGVGREAGHQNLNDQSGLPKPEGADETHNRIASRTSTSSISAGMIANSSAATHSRSPSVTSTTFSSFGPLSASTSSSASSSFGEFSASPSTPRRAMRLSNLDRRALCQYAEANPRVKHEHIGSMFGVERSTVSKILKQKAKWFSVSDDNTIPLSPMSDRRTKDGKAYKNRIGRFPEMEAMLLEWGKQQTRGNIVLTDEAVRSKALEFAEQLKIDSGSFKASAGWLENFKDRAKYKAGKFDLDAPPPSMTQSSASSRDPSEEVMESETPRSENFANAERTTSSDMAGSQALVQRGAASDTLPSHMQSAHMFVGRAPSPLRHRRQKRGGLSSLSSSSISLPDLTEQEEHRSTSMDNSSSSADLRSSGSSSFSNLNMRPLTQASRHQHQSSLSYSTDSSPYPSPTCSTGSELSQSLTSSNRTSFSGPLAHTSTPTQRTVYDASYTPQSSEFHFRDAYSIAPPSTPLQQAGINFNLSLNSSPYPQPARNHLRTIEAGQPVDLRHLSAPYNLGTTSSPVDRNAPDADQGNIIHSSRLTLHSANDISLQPQIARFAMHADDVGHNPYAQNSSSVETSSLLHQMQQHRAPLHRSQTDPMPLYYSLGTMDKTGNTVHHPGDSTLVPADAVHAGDLSLMQVDSIQQQMHEGAMLYHHNQYSPHAGQVYIQAPHARRATVSSGGDLSLSSGSGTGSSYGHGASYSMSAVTTPVFGSFPSAVEEPAPPYGDTKVSLHDAYLSLRKVVRFLQEETLSDTLRTSLATSSQAETLDALLAQFKQAHLSQIPTLTPPKSL